MSIVEHTGKEAEEMDDKVQAILPQGAKYTLVWVEADHLPGVGHKVGVLGNVERQGISARMMCSMLAEMLQGPDSDEVETYINQYILPIMLDRTFALLDKEKRSGNAN